MPSNCWAGVVRLLAERQDTKSNVKLGGFWTQLQTSDVSSHPEVLWYNKILSMHDNIYIYNYFFLNFYMIERLVCIIELSKIID